MASTSSQNVLKKWHQVSVTTLEPFINACLKQAGADAASAGAVARSLVGTSLRGVDSHGIRLLPHYLEVLQKGRINGAPQMAFQQLTAAAGLLDADDGFGHLAGYRAIEEGIKLARNAGIGVVSVINSSHFGAAGSYALAAAEAGYLALVMSNSDKLVLAHDGVEAFHGTNPISFAAPVRGKNPYLIDMATSSISYNRVLHYRSIGQELPADVAVDATGTMCTDADAAAALLPLGGQTFGFKGAALAGMCEVLCAAITGMGFSHQLLAFHGKDLSSKRHLGQFFFVMKPDIFFPTELYDQHFSTYLNSLRQSPASADTEVMAPGDREWRIKEQRSQSGIPVDPHLWIELNNLAGELQVPPLMTI